MRPILPCLNQMQAVRLLVPYVGMSVLTGPYQALRTLCSHPPTARIRLPRFPIPIDLFAILLLARILSDFGAA